MVTKSPDSNRQETEPEVVVMGEKVNDNWGRKHGSDGIVWGVFLVFAGAMLLLNTLEVVSWDVWSKIWQFWPVLLILIGVRILLGRNIIARVIVTVLTIAVFGFITLMVVYETNSSLFTNLPENVTSVFNNAQSYIK